LAQEAKDTTDTGRAYSNGKEPLCNGCGQGKKLL